VDTSKFLGKFRDATLDHLKRMNEILMLLEQDPSRDEEVTELMREIHTLKGESRMMGYADMSDLSHAIEDVLKAQEDAGFRTLGAVSDPLFRAFDLVEALLREKLGQGDAHIDVEQACADLRASAGLEQPAPAAPLDEEELELPAGPRAHVAEIPDLPELPTAPERAGEGLDLRDVDLPDADDEEEDDGWVPPEQGAEDPAAAMREAFGVPAGVAQEIGEGGQVAAPGARAVSMGGGTERFMARFRDAARRRLELLREALLSIESGEGVEAALRRAVEEAEALSEESRVMGFHDMADLASGMGAALTALRSVKNPSEDERLAAVTLALDAEGRLLVARLGGDVTTIDVAALVRRLVAESPGMEGTTGFAVVPSESVAPAPEAASPAGQRAHAEETVRVSRERLDLLATLAGDIYLSHARGEDRLRRLRALVELTKVQARAAMSLRQALSAMGGGAVSGAVGHAHDELSETLGRMRRQVHDLLREERDESLRVGHSVVELRQRVREMQMLPVGTLFDAYPRMVRDLARDLGKHARLIVEGADVEIDRRVLDEIRDPLLHLLRNAVDHGLESPAERTRRGKPPQGSVTLSARAEGDQVVIEVRDDGGGIDPAMLRAIAVRKGVLEPARAEEASDEQILQVIFSPGFSSRDAVTDISGRGVGLDVVREKAERLEGSLVVRSEIGRGSRFEMRVPLTLSLARLVVVRAGGLLVAMPAANIVEARRIKLSEVQGVEGYPAMDWEGRPIPLASLAQLLKRQETPPDDDGRTVAILEWQGRHLGFVVDALAGEREAVVKRLSHFLGDIPNVAGATILSSGEIVVVLNIPQLVASTLGLAPLRLETRGRGDERQAAARRRRLLVVDDSIIVRDMMKGVLEAAGYDVSLAVDGLDGLEKQLAGRYDAVISDVEMPRMDGFELTRSLRQSEAGARVPVVIVTTLDSQESRERGLREGASAYLVKNLLDMSQLLGTIERLVS